MVAQAFNPSTWEADFWVKASLVYKVSSREARVKKKNPLSKKKKKNQKEKQTNKQKNRTEKENTPQKSHFIEVQPQNNYLCKRNEHNYKHPYEIFIIKNWK